MFGPGAAVVCLEKSTLEPYPNPHDLFFDGSEGVYLKSVCLRWWFGYIVAEDLNRYALVNR